MKLFERRKKTRILIDYSICGDGTKVDPRKCHKCMTVCAPAVFLLHESDGLNEDNELDPQIWRITPLYLSLCTKCMKCVEICPEHAITIN